MRGGRRGVVLLRAVARPGAHLDARGMSPRDRRRVVGALGIDDDDLVGPCDRGERRVDIRRFVPSYDRDGQFRHTGSLYAALPATRRVCPTGIRQTRQRELLLPAADR